MHLSLLLIERETSIRKLNSRARLGRTSGNRSEDNTRPCTSL
jgi:hypothetical protein